MPHKKHLTNKTHLVKKYVCRVPEEKHSAKNPLRHGKEKTLSKLTCLLSVLFFGTQQTRSLASAREKHSSKRNSKHILKK
jgi:hypothetical protein